MRRVTEFIVMAQLVAQLCLLLAVANGHREELKPLSPCERAGDCRYRTPSRVLLLLRHDELPLMHAPISGYAVTRSVSPPPLPHLPRLPSRQQSSSILIPRWPLCCTYDSAPACCSLGGVCTPAGICACDPAFTGPTCALLNLLPAPTTPLWTSGAGSAGAATASWGGNVVFDDGDGKWHLFFAELLYHCPLKLWGTNSVVSHAVGDSAMGPFVKKEVVQPAFHHNPTIAYDLSTRTFLLISIGAGGSQVRKRQLRHHFRRLLRSTSLRHILAMYHPTHAV